MLTEAKANRAYRLFYGEGMTLRQVMHELGCGLYDLPPWLTAPASRIAAAAIEDERERVAGRSALSTTTKGEGDGR
ncbi:hypothetical protein [Methylobacterium sp. CM6244]